MFFVRDCIIYSCDKILKQRNVITAYKQMFFSHQLIFTQFKLQGALTLTAKYR